jgi:amidase
MSETLSRDTLDASATDLVEALAVRRVTALELADVALARGERRPLLGLPMTVKESHNVAGLPTTWGFEPFKDYVARTDSVGVARLKAAGAVILGKTNVPPWLADYQSNNPVYGRTRNPFDTARTPGGSSGGSAAALAAGMVPLEFGSDIGGSIRMPAHFCGVYGHKPSYNLIPLRGHSPPYVPEGAGVVLAVVGPLARTAADLSLALDVLAGPDEGEATGYRLALPPPRHARLADYRVLLVDQHPATPLDDEIRAGLNDLAADLEKLGAKVARSSDLLPDLGQVQAAFMGLLMPAMSRGQPGAQTISAHEWMALLDTQAQIRRQWARLFEDFDVVLTPVHGAHAFPHDDEPDPTKRTLVINGQVTPYFAPAAWAGLATLGNLPSTVIPVGQTRSGLPFGAQVIGPYLEDRTTIGFAGLAEREFGGFRPPPGF